MMKMMTATMTDSAITTTVELISSLRVGQVTLRISMYTLFT